MKTSYLSLCFVTCLIPAFVKAQIIPPFKPPGPPYYILTNVIQNPGFDSGSLAPYWINTSTESDIDDGTAPLAVLTSTHHASGYGLDLLTYRPYHSGAEFDPGVYQNLTRTLGGNSVYEANVWAYAGKGGVGLLFIGLGYTDGSGSSKAYQVDSNTTSTGWVQINFKGLVKTSKTISSISFSTGSLYGDSIVIDDVVLSAFILQGS